MTPEEANLISGLFQRLRSADTPNKDAEAAQFIQGQMASFPSASYLLIQTVLVQEHALQNAQARIAELERKTADLERKIVDGSDSRFDGGGNRGSFLSGLFGSRPATPPPAPVSAAAAPPPLPPATTASLPPSAGGGFLKGALATAAGVAGGALLFEGIQNLVGHQAGVFGSGLGNAGGLAEVPLTENVEVVNNYYGSDPAQQDDMSQNANDLSQQGDPGDAYAGGDWNTDPGSDWNADPGDSDFSGDDGLV